MKTLHSPWIAKPDVIDFALATSQGDWRKAYYYAAERRQAESLAATREGLRRYGYDPKFASEAWAVLEGFTTLRNLPRLEKHIRDAWRDQHA